MANNRGNEQSALSAFVIRHSKCIITTRANAIFNIIACLSSCLAAGLFEPYLVASPEDRFAHVDLSQTTFLENLNVCNRLLCRSIPSM